MENINQDVYFLQGLARQESSIIELIYKNNYHSIQSLIIKNNGSSDDAADIIQEAMIILYQKSIDKDFILTLNVGNSQLYKQVGNSVTVNVIERIASNIINVLKKVDKQDLKKKQLVNEI